MQALAVNCYVVIYCLEVICKEDQITIFVQMTDEQ